MEKATFNAHLSRLQEVFPGKETITIPDAAKFCGCDPRTLRADRSFPAKKFGNKMKVSVINLARWLAC